MGPHAAFKVSDLDRAIAGRAVILGPYEPIAGFPVAAIDDGGVAIELIETSLTDQEIWGGAKSSSRLHDQDPQTREMLETEARPAGRRAPRRSVRTILSGRVVPRRPPDNGLSSDASVRPALRQHPPRRANINKRKRGFKERKVRSADGQ
jgi:hypothetical protein